MAGLQIQTRSNGETTLQEETVRKFKESLRGELIRVGDSGMMTRARSGTP